MNVKLLQWSESLKVLMKESINYVSILVVHCTGSLSKQPRLLITAQAGDDGGLVWWQGDRSPSIIPTLSGFRIQWLLILASDHVVISFPVVPREARPEMWAPHGCESTFPWNQTANLPRTCTKWRSLNPREDRFVAITLRP